MNCPILFIVFNRVETSQSVFSEIRKYKPKKLFISADGPRSSHEFEIEKCLEVRRLVTQIDWDCELYTLFREVNVGCGIAVSSAINWFFKHVDEGIILEDDCLPCEGFFRFMSLSLEKFRHNNEIMHIGGVSYLGSLESQFYDYRISRYGHIWGWGTWKRAWEKYNLLISDNDKDIERNVGILKSIVQQNYWKEVFVMQREKPIDTWDYSWQYALLKHDGYCIYPKTTLVLNIGFGPLATHTTSIPRVLPNLSNEKYDFRSLTTWCFNRTLFNRYYDYVSFMRAFKNKDLSAFDFKTFSYFLYDNLQAKNSEAK